MDRHFKHMIPLVVFTMLAIVSAGLALGSAALAGSPGLMGAAAVGTLAGIAMSMLHLGRKQRFFRAGLGLFHSWLSREVIVAGGFAGVSLFTATGGYNYIIGGGLGLWVFLAAGLGVLLVLTLGMVYYLEARPSWFVRLQALTPLVSAVLLGTALVGRRDRLYAVILYTVWTIDFAAALARGRRFFELRPYKSRFVFPRLIRGTYAGHGLRLLLSPLFLVFLMTGRFAFGLGVLGAQVMLDRLLFYMGMEELSPRARMAEEKSKRMAQAIFFNPQ